MVGDQKPDVGGGFKCKACTGWVQILFDHRAGPEDVEANVLDSLKNEGKDRHYHRTISNGAVVG